MNINMIYTLAMPTLDANSSHFNKASYPLKQCKCVNLNSVPEYNQPYLDHLHVQLLTKLP